MRFEEPKIEFIKLDMEDIITSSGGASIVICAEGANQNSQAPDVPIED